MTVFDEATLKHRITAFTERAAPARIKIFEDTTEFIEIEAGSVLRLAGNDYLVMGNAREGRFGIDDQPKFWVKSAIDLTMGVRKFIKLVFHETFKSRIGALEFDCVRSSEKEAAVLTHMKGHPNFMQGLSVSDAAGNLVRIIDVVAGPSLYDYLRRMELTHEAYYHQRLNTVLQPVMESITAIASLHKLGLNHGDIRADHLLVENNSNAFVWIDFDYDVGNQVYDLYCLGNVLLQAIGKGRHSLHDIRLRPSEYPHLKDALNAEDMSLMFQHRVANLQKLFPYIKADLNDVLMRFSLTSATRYQSADDLVADLRALFPSD